MKRSVQSHVAFLLNSFQPAINQGMQSKPFDKHLAAFFKENKGIRQESKQLIANKSY